MDIKKTKNLLPVAPAKLQNEKEAKTSASIEDRDEQLDAVSQASQKKESFFRNDVFIYRKIPASRNLVDKGELWEGRSRAQEVVPNVLISNFFGARNLSLLKSEQITHVLVCADELPTPHSKKAAYLKLKGLTDNTGTCLDTHLEQALPWIKRFSKDGSRVLLHCASGSSRSGAVLVAYLMWDLDLSMSNALEMVQSHRPIVSPNSGFKEQLKSMEGKIASRYR